MLASGLLFGGSQAWAAAPPANTVIGNQATADYIDPNGLTQSATSNMVRTTVQQVGSFNLDGQTAETSSVVVNTKTGAASAVLYAPHVLTNTGNGADGFAINITFPNTPNTLAGTSVYADANFDGLPDSTTALCSVTPVPVGTTSVCDVLPQTVAGNNGQFGFVVAYQLPSSLPGGFTPPYALAKVTATPAAPAMYAVGNKFVATVDQVNATNAAAFNLTKAVQQPLNGIAAPGGGAWPAAPVSGRRSSDASCATSWSAGLTSSATCQYTVYTLTYSNSGGAPGRFVMQDAIGGTPATAGLQYVTGSAVWSGASGTALGDTGADPAGVDYAFDAGTSTLTFVDNALPVNTQRSVSFVVLVKNTAAVGTTSTTNVARYNPVDASGATTSAPGVVSSATNSATFTVQGTYSIAMGASPSTAATALDATPGTPNATSSTADTTTVGNAAAGAAVAFTQIVYNTGNDTDTVNITSANPGTATGTQFPAGTTFAYYKADGATPLNDTNADGTVDTGPIAAGGSVNIVVKAVLPGTITPATAASYTFTVTGTSSGDSTKLDATRNVLTSVTGALVDLTNSPGGSNAAGSGDQGTGPSTQPTTTGTVTAGATFAFELWVKNNDSVANTYSLAASSTTTFPGTLPAGWTVKFVAGAATPASCASAAAISSVAVDSTLQGHVTACVTPPANQANLTASPVYFQVRSTLPTSTGNVVIDTKYDALTVTAAALTYTATLTPNNSGQVASGGSVVYAHTLANTGTASCTTGYKIETTMPPASTTAGWTTAIYLDVNSDGILDAGDSLVTPNAPLANTLAVGGSQALLVKVFAPGGAVANETSTVTVKVTFEPGAASCGAPSATDLSSVIAGQIRVGKTQALDATCGGVVGTQSANPILAAKPGECITYVVTATNEGTATLTNLTIYDAIPAYTSLNATQPAAATQCVSTGITGPLTYAAASGSVSCGSATNTVSPGATATLTFQVKVNQ